MARPIQSQDVQPVDQRDSDFRSFEAAPIRGLAADAGGGKDDEVVLGNHWSPGYSPDVVNQNAWGIDNSTPDTPPGVKSDSQPV